MTMRVTTAFALVLTLLVSAFAALPAAAQEEPPVVLVWGGSYGFRHPSITQGELAFTQLGLQTGKFTAIVTENPADLNATMLQQVDAIAWISTTGKPPFTQQQRDDIIRFAGCGGGTLAFHAAADSNYGWAEYAELLGAQFDSHPKNAGSGAATVLVEDDEHPITAGWAGRSDFQLDDEYYRWRGAQGLPGVSLPRDLPDTHVLLSLDETTVGDTIQSGPTPYEHRQPIAWTKTFRGAGRVYYNNMGHSDGTWAEPEFRTSLVNGVDWVTGKRLDSACFNSDDPLPAPQHPPAHDPDAEPPIAGVPCEIPETAQRTGFTWQSSAPLKALTEAGDRLTLPSAGLPGGLGWGAQFYILDLSESGALAADVIVELQIPNPLDDYDLSVTTGWGWYGSQAPQGADTERVVIRNAPHCAVLQMYGDNLYAVSGQAPTLDVTVTQNAPSDPPAPNPVPDLPPVPTTPPLTGVVTTIPNGTLLGFAPTKLVLTQGSTLTFVNGDNTTHDVTCQERDPVTRKPICGSDYLNTGQSGQVHGVPELPPGTHAFNCSLHSGMAGELTIL
jgi:type 1 glutamine amidotransferase/plastocyanin